MIKNDQKLLKTIKNDLKQQKMTQNDSRQPKMTINDAKKLSVTDGQTDGAGCRVACTRLKMLKMLENLANIFAKQWHTLTILAMPYDIKIENGLGI